MISRFRSRWFVPRSVDSRNQVTWKPNAEYKKHLEELKNSKMYDSTENDIDQLHKTIADLTRELEETKNLVKSNEDVVRSTRRIALASLDVASHATPKPNSAQKRLLSEHEVYAPKTKKVKLPDEMVKSEDSMNMT